MEIYPALFAVMSILFSNAIFTCLLLTLAMSSADAQPNGLLEGHLRIISAREVELADETPSRMTAENYTDYRLIILSPDPKREIARITADENGNYRASLPPGDYVLDTERRGHGHIRATAQPFTVVSNQTVRVDMTIDTGVR